jgi:hypothetical protein
MNDAVRDILRANGCDTGLEAPYSKFLSASNPVCPDDQFASFDTSELRRSFEPPPDSATDYAAIRRFYVAKIRNELRSRLIADKFRSIRETLTNGGRECISELFAERHNWRVGAARLSPSGIRICVSPRCPNAAVPGSEFCVAHILLDPNQKLFAECPTATGPSL